MNSTTITADREEAQEKLETLQQLQQSLGDKFSDDDKLLLAAYREVAAGRRLIDVNAAIAEGGLNLAGFPRLAIARADRERVFWQASWQSRYDGPGNTLQQVPDGGGDYNYASSRFRKKTDRHVWTVPAATFPAESVKRSAWIANKGNLVANVPYIPAHLRPTRGLGEMFILFECNWYWTKERPLSSPDPFLLKQVHGSLMSIVAEWDLSGLEQKIFDSALR